MSKDDFLKALQLILLLILPLFSSFGQGKEKPEINFDPAGGIYTGGVEVALSAPEGARIYYTTDGSKPNSSCSKYKSPIKVKGVVVIRAIAYLNGKRSPVKTNTYFCDREYTLPVVSLAVKEEVFFDSLEGIYMKGCCADTVEPYLNANFWKDWEREVNIEMYLPTGELCFNEKVGVSIFGGYSRWLPQKSIATYVRSKYGPKKIHYPIFPERDFDKYNNFILRNSGGDFKRTHLRDAFMTQLAKPTGLAIQEYRPAAFFINGRYWGIQNLREKINEHYLESNFDVDEDNVDILRQHKVARHGNSRNYKKLLAFLRNHDTSQDSVIKELKTFMDVDDYIRYNIAEVYSDNRDAGGNIRYWRERTDSAKWRWVFYDLDQGLGNNAPDGYKRNTLKKFTSINNEKWPDPPWSTFIIRKLLENKKIQTQYINTFADHLNTVYHPDTATKLLYNIKEPLNEEMKYHVQRWGTSIKNWEHHIAIVDHFVKQRPHWCRKHIMEKFNIEDTVLITVRYPGKDAAKVKFNSLKIKKDFAGIYFTGVPVKISVKPEHDYKLMGWKGREEKDATLAIVPKKDLILEPIIQPKERSKYSDSIIFSELMVFQQEKDTTRDWFELYNNSKKRIDLSSWGFTDKKYKDRFVFPDSTFIEADSFIIVAEHKALYAKKYNTDTVRVIGGFEFGLSRETEHIKLYDNNGLIVDSLTYNFGLDSIIDSTFTFNLIHPDSARHLAGNWVRETPSPGDHSTAFKQFLKHEEDKRKWMKMFYIGGGSFFFILLVGVLFYRFYKKKKRAKNT